MFNPVFESAMFVDFVEVDNFNFVVESTLRFSAVIVEPFLTVAFVFDFTLVKLKLISGKALAKKLVDNFISEIAPNETSFVASIFAPFSTLIEVSTLDKLIKSLTIKLTTSPK